MVQNKKRIISLILMLTLLVSSLVVGAITASAADGTWQLVTNASDLKAGDKVIIVAKDYNYAMSTTQNNNNRGQASVTKSGNTVTLGEGVQEFTLENGTVSGSFAFKVGAGYIYAASNSNNYLKTETSKTGNSSWKITITSGTASIVAQGTNSRKYMQYNQSSSLFACYSSASQKAIVIYKWVESTSTEPSCEHTNKVAIGEEKAATCTEAGITAGVKCKDCGEVIEAQTAIPATGHNYKYYACESCGIDRPQATYSVPAGVTTEQKTEGAANDNTIKLPSEVTFTGTGYSNYTLIGWTTSKVEETTSKPDFYNPGDTAPLAENTTFYALFSYTVGNVSTDYVKKDISEIQPTDVVVITMTKGTTVYAITNNNGTSSAPVAVTVTVSGNKLSGDIADILKWNITNSNGNLTIYPNGETSTWLYCTNTNNGVRVGTNANKVFTIDGDYLKNTATSRFVGVFIDNPDWRCYDNTNKNIGGQTLAFYVCSQGTTLYTTELACDHDYNYDCDKVCKYCGVETRPEATHTYTNYTSNNDATCVKDGTKTGTCSCGAKDTVADTGSKLEHTERTPATCTAKAVCTVCGTSYGELAAHEYSYSCDAHCKNCGELTNEDASHTPVHVEAKAPTCTENGNVEYWYCSVCGSAWLDVDYTIQTNLKAVVLGATCATNAVHNERVEAGCTTTGLIENWYCANCDVYYLDAACTIITNYKNLTIPALEHNTEGVVDHKDATCTEDGVEGGTYCTRCNEGKADAEATIPATGHATEVEYWTYGNNLYYVPVCGCLTEKVLIDTTNALPVANEEDLVFLVTHGFNVFLDADINLTKTLDIEGAIVTIDLNGKTLKADWESDGVIEVIHVHDASHLTIVGDGNVISGGQYKAATNSVISCRVYSQLTIKGGNYYSASYGDVIFCETSSIVRIEGGRFEAATDYLGTWYVLDIDETETYNRGQFIVTGGTFVNFNPANHTNDGKGYTNKVAPGYITEKVGNTYVVSVFEAPADPTEKVTISNPFTLAEDVILNGELVIKNGAVIDLNGCTIESSAVITFNGTIIDTVGTGKIIVNVDSETNKPMLQIAKGNYDYAPIHIETKDGKSTYAITPVKVQGVTAELSNTAVVRPSLKGNVYTNQALFAPTGDQKVIPHGITFELLVTRTKDGVSEDAYVSLDNIDLTQLYADKQHAIKITLKGGLEGYTYTVKFVVKSADTQVHVSDVIATRTVPVKPKEEIIPETTNN